MAEIRDPQTYAIIGAAMEIHKQLVGREVLLPVLYKEKLIAQYRADFVCFSEIIVEFKAQSQLTGVDEAQVLNYLKATAFQRALLINFGGPSLEYKRLIFSQNKEKSQKSAKSAD